MNEVYPVYGFGMNLESHTIRTSDMQQSGCVYVCSILIGKLIVQIIFPKHISSDFISSECCVWIWAEHSYSQWEIHSYDKKRWENVKVTN